MLQVLLSATIAFAGAASGGEPAHPRKEAIMNQTAHGPFDVELGMLQTYNQADPAMGRRSIDKRFHGDLDATSQGEMLSVGTARDNGGYVASKTILKTKVVKYVARCSAVEENRRRWAKCAAVKAY